MGTTELPSGKSNYERAHSSFKREFKVLRKRINDTNRYKLGDIEGKLNIFEAKSEGNDDNGEAKPVPNGSMDRYKIRRIVGSNGLTRLKENKSSYAIGDKDGNPITGFDFIYVPYHTEGERNSYVEVITKGGDVRRFNCDSHELTECMGVGAIGGGAAAAVGTATAGGEMPSGGGDNGGISHADSINYKDVQDEMLLPTKQNMRFLAGGYPFRKAFKGKKRKHSKLV